MQVRVATAKDNEKMIAIEQLTPQGQQIKLTSERKDYFIRANKFEDPIFLVAEDQNSEEILGIMGVGPVSLRFKGETVKGGFIFDWRSNPATQKGLQRHMLRLWEAAQTEVARHGLDFVFGYVKEDNQRSRSVLEKYGARPVEIKEFLTLSVHSCFCKDKEGVANVDFSRQIDRRTEQETLEKSFGQLDFFSESLNSDFFIKQQERYMYGHFSYKNSAVKVWDTNTEYTQRVMNLPLLYKLARPFVSAASKLVPLPVIPKIGDELRMWQLYDLILDQPKDLFYLLEKVRQEAVKDKINYLVICSNSKDKGYEQIARKALIKLKYYVYFLPLKDLPLPEPPTYFNISYL